MGRFGDLMERMGVNKADVPGALIALKMLNYVVLSGSFVFCYKFRPILRFLPKSSRIRRQMALEHLSNRAKQFGNDVYKLEEKTARFERRIKQVLDRRTWYQKAPDFIEEKSTALSKTKIITRIAKFLKLNSQKLSLAGAEAFLFYKVTLPIHLPLQAWLIVSIMRKRHEKMLERINGDELDSISGPIKFTPSETDAPADTHLNDSDIDRISSTISISAEERDKNDKQKIAREYINMIEHEYQKSKEIILERSRALRDQVQQNYGSENIKEESLRCNDIKTTPSSSSESVYQGTEDNQEDSTLSDLDFKAQKTREAGEALANTLFSTLNLSELESKIHDKNLEFQRMELVERRRVLDMESDGLDSDDGSLTGGGESFTASFNRLVLLYTNSDMLEDDLDEDTKKEVMS